MLEKFRGYMDLGRVQGVSTTAGVSILGALTSNNYADVNIITALEFILIAFFAHTSGATINEICDARLDSLVPELSKKPLVRGIISRREAILFAVVPFLISTLLIAIFFNPTATFIFLLSALTVALYSIKGKRTPITYEFTFPLGYTLYALFGVFALGVPTDITYVALACIFLALMFGQWENEMKDVDTDKMLDLPSLPSRWNYSLGKALSIKDKNLIFGLSLKVLLFMVYLTPLMIIPHTGLPLYFFIFVIVGIPSQLYVIYSLFKVKSRREWVRLILIDVAVTWILAPALIIDRIGFVGFFSLILLVIGGYLLGSLAQSGAEFKFRQFAED